MRTFEEQLIFDVTGVKTESFSNYSNFATDKVELTKLIRLAYNQALEDAAENAETIYPEYLDGNNAVNEVYVDKDSILKLKKSVSSTV